MGLGGFGACRSAVDPARHAPFGCQNVLASFFHFGCHNRGLKAGPSFSRGRDHSATISHLPVHLEVIFSFSLAIAQYQRVSTVRSLIPSGSMLTV